MTEKIFNSIIQDFLTQNGFVFTLQGNNYIMTQSKGGNQTDCNLLKNGTAVRDTSSFCTLELKGSEVLDFLNRITTNDLRGLKAGESIRTLFCSDKGRIIDSVLLVNEGTRFLLFGSVGSSDKLTRWINKYIINDDVHVKDITGSFGSFEIYGPQAQTFIILLSGIKEEEAGKLYNFEFEDKTLSLVKSRFADKIEKYLIFGDTRAFDKLTPYILNYDGPFSVGFVSEPSVKDYYLSKKLPGVNELSDYFNPHEVKLMTEVSLKKGCYIGQEIIARLDTYDKVQKFLVNLEISHKFTGDLPAALEDENGTDAGVLTSVSQFGNNGCLNALGVVKKANLEVGKKLVVNSSTGKYTAVVKEL
jgi:folate-binding protein YgfZ